MNHIREKMHQLRFKPGSSSSCSGGLGEPCSSIGKTNYYMQVKTPELFDHGNGMAIPGSSCSGGAGWDIKYDENEIKICLEMPGLEKGDIQVSVEDDKLVIKGQCKDLARQHCWSGRSSYDTCLQLPENSDRHNIKAELKNGILFISIPQKKLENNNISIKIQ